MRLGIIGVGNMGFALLKGLLQARVASAAEIVASDLDELKLARASELGARVAKSNKELAEWADVIILAVKPKAVEQALSELPLEGKLLISLAAGVTLSSLERWSNARVIRLMPNLCAEVGELAACYAPGSRTKPEDEKVVEEIFGKLGRIFKVREDLMDAVTGLAGSGPAFFFYYLQAAEEAGKELGLDPELARALVAQTAKGAASMILGGADPEELIRRISTPGGTTARGMEILTSRGAAQILRDAIKVATKRAAELSR
jgi:pyrroline-5-carboxylate reductase